MAAAKRIKGYRLQQIRLRHRRYQPLCVRCEKKGRIRAWTQLDHIVALDNGGEESLDPFVNRQGLCDACHVEKTAEDMGYEHRPTIGVDGYPIE